MPKRIIICEVCFKDDVTDETIEELYTTIHQKVKEITQGTTIYVDTSNDVTDYDV